MPTCLFCNLAQPAQATTWQFADEHVIVLDDINPQAPVHQLIIPRQHIATLNELKPEDSILIGHLFQIACQQAKKLGIAEAGYRTVFNCNKAGGQVIYHLHLHLLGGRPLHWPPG